jgi:hypothetical protein
MPKPLQVKLLASCQRQRAQLPRGLAAAFGHRLGSPLQRQDHVARPFWGLVRVRAPEDGGTICTQKVGEAEREITTAEEGRKASERVLTSSATLLSGSSAADPTNLRVH